MAAETEPAAAGQPAPAAEAKPRGRPVPVPHIDFSTPTGNELVEVRKGYGLTPPADNTRPAGDSREQR